MLFKFSVTTTKYHRMFVPCRLKVNCQVLLRHTEISSTDGLVVRQTYLEKLQERF